MKSRILIVAALLLQSCSLLNPLLTEKAFKEYADEHIGSNIDNLIEQPSYKLMRAVSLKIGLTEYQLEHTYHSTQSGREYSCEWTLVANDETRLVESWRYISEPSKCMHRFFYEGAW